MVKWWVDELAAERAVQKAYLKDKLTAGEMVDSKVGVLVACSVGLWDVVMVAVKVALKVALTVVRLEFVKDRR